MGNRQIISTVIIIVRRDEKGFAPTSVVKPHVGGLGH